MSPQDYVSRYFDAAYKAYQTFGVHPIATLAQGAIESNWGGSNMALRANNLFGITAAGATNEYWKGGIYAATTGLKFRVYGKPEDSIMDFGRLIASKYKSSAAVSSDIAAYARSISRSPYISESNGDNRGSYERSIVQHAGKISPMVDKLLDAKKK